MTNIEIESRMRELMKPVDVAIMLCDSNEEILMLASVMHLRLKSIYDTQLGIEGRKEMFKDKDDG